MIKKVSLLVLSYSKKKKLTSNHGNFLFERKKRTTTKKRKKKKGVFLGVQIVCFCLFSLSIVSDSIFQKFFVWLFPRTKCFTFLSGEMGENDEYQTPLDIGGSLLCVGSSCRKVNEAYRLCVEENTSENPVCSALLRKRNDCLRQCIAPRQFHNFYHWRKTDKKAEQYKNAELEMETSFRTFVDTIVNDKSLEMMQSYQRIMNNLTEGCRPQFTKVEECLRQNSRAECRAEIQASELCMIRGRIGYSDEWKGFSRCISEGKRRLFLLFLFLNSSIS